MLTEFAFCFDKCHSKRQMSVCVVSAPGLAVFLPAELPVGNASIFRASNN